MQISIEHFINLKYFTSKMDYTRNYFKLIGFESRIILFSNLYLEMKKRIDAIKIKREEKSTDQQNHFEQDRDKLIDVLLKSQKTTNQLLESLMLGQKQILYSLQDSQNLLGKVVRIEGALYKKVNSQNQSDTPLQKTFYKTTKSQKKNVFPKVQLEPSNTKKHTEKLKDSKQQICEKNMYSIHSSQFRAPQEFRDITINIKVPDIIIQNINKLSFDQLGGLLQGWLADLFTCLSKATFAGYYQRKKLTQSQSKIYFSRNLIFNVVNLIQIAKSCQLNLWKKEGKKMIRMFESGSKKVIGFLKLKYPQKKKTLYNPETDKLIQAFDDSQNINFDIVYNSGCCFNNKQQSWIQIKTFLNRILKQIRTHYEPFTQQMLKIFTISKGKQQFTLKNLIGSKIDVNVPFFDQKQLKKPGIKIVNSQVLRTIVKWIQCIQKVFFQTDQFFEKRDGQSFKFKTSFERLTEQQQKKYKQQILKQVPNIQILKNNQKESLDRLVDDLPSFIQKYQQTFSYLPPAQYEVGLFTSIMTKGIHDAISQYLEELINKLIDIGGDYNFLYFDVFDILRCKCSGTKQQILKVYNNLQKSKYFKIVRVKNRMKTSNQDFLVNMKIQNSPIVCQLQLCLSGQKNEQTQKQDYLNQFNHFLYELQRSSYGPICESVILCSSLSDTISFFSIDNLPQKTLVCHPNHKFQNIQLKLVDEVKPLKRDRPSIIELPLKQDALNSQFKDVKKKKYQISDQNYTLENNNYSFICKSCKLFVQSYKTFVDIFKSINQGFSVCGDCVLSSLSESDRTKYLVGVQYEDYLEQTTLKQIEKQKPEFICVIEKSYRKKIIFLRSIQTEYGGYEYINFNYKYGDKITMSYQDLKECYLFNFKTSLKKISLSLDNKLFERLKTKKEDRKMKKPQFYLLDQVVPNIIKKQSQSYKVLECKDKLKRLPMDVLLLVKDYVSKQPMVLTAFVVQCKPDIRILDIQPLDFKDYYQQTIKKSIKEKKISEFIQQNKRVWFYKNKDLSEEDFVGISAERMKSIQTLECPKSQFTKIPCQLVNIKELYLNDNNITEIDLEYLNFTKLEYLNVQRNKLSKITGFKTCLNLCDLRLSNNCLKKLDFYNVQLNQLTYLDLMQNPIQMIEGMKKSDGKKALKAPKLKTLYIGMNDGQELDFSGIRSQCLFDLICEGNPKTKTNIQYPELMKIAKLKITNLSILPFYQQKFNSLIFISLQKVSMEEFTLSKNFQFENLESLSIINCNIKSINVYCDLKKLKQFKISKSFLEDIFFGPGVDMNEITQINLSHNLLKKFDLTQIETIDKLQKLNLGYNMITQLNLKPSKLPSLKTISIDHNPNPLDIVSDYMQYGFTDFNSLDSIEFGYDLDKAETIFWFFKTIQKEIKTQQSLSHEWSVLITKVLQLDGYCSLSPLNNMLISSSSRIQQNKTFKQFVESAKTLGNLIQKRGGEIEQKKANLFRAIVSTME